MDSRPSTLCIGDSHRLRAAVMRLVHEARELTDVERQSVRQPFFRPVQVGLDDDGPPRFSAFCRDLSLHGVGLLHIMPLHCREVVVRFRTRKGDPIDFRVAIEWCQDFGEGWYVSGGRLVDVA